MRGCEAAAVAGDERQGAGVGRGRRVGVGLRGGLRRWGLEALATPPSSCQIREFSRPKMLFQWLSEFRTPFFFWKDSIYFTTKQTATISAALRVPYVYPWAAWQGSDGHAVVVESCLRVGGGGRIHPSRRPRRWQRHCVCGQRGRSGGPGERPPGQAGCRGRRGRAMASPTLTRMSPLRPPQQPPPTLPPEQSWLGSAVRVGAGATR